MTTDRQRVAEQTAKELAGMVYVVIKDCIESFSTEHGIECSIRDSESIEGTKEVLTGIISRHLRALEHSEQGWVSVETSLPEVHKDVHVWVIFKGHNEGETVDSWLDPDGGWAMGSAKGYKVTHWRPLPAPPVQPESAQTAGFQNEYL